MSQGRRGRRSAALRRGPARPHGDPADRCALRAARRQADPADSGERRRAALRDARCRQQAARAIVEAAAADERRPAAVRGAARPAQSGRGVVGRAATGQTSPRAVRVFTAVAYALPHAKLYAPDGLDDTTFSDDSIGGIPAGVAERTKLTVPTLGRNEYGTAGKKFFDAYRVRYVNSDPEQYAIHAYDAMSLLLARRDRPLPHRRAQGRRQGAVRDPRPRERARQVLDRHPRRHRPHDLRRLSHRRRPAAIPADDRRSPVAWRSRMLDAQPTFAVDVVTRLRCCPAYRRP